MRSSFVTASGGVLGGVLGSVLIGAAALSCGEPGELPSEDVGVTQQAVSTMYMLPLKCKTSTTITQGNNSGFSHTGVSAYGFDFGVGLNTPLVAVRAGTVTHVNNSIKPGDPCYEGGYYYGQSCLNRVNYVTLDHGNGRSSVYVHLNHATVKVGDRVAQGQQVGLSGGTGYSTGPHAHVQLMNTCGAYYCQSVPMAFGDVSGDGVPDDGDKVTSKNGCADAPVVCSLGDGYYCGENGTDGDPNALYLCTGGKPAKVEDCTFGCKHEVPGVDDRCYQEAENPPGRDAGPSSDGGPTSEADAGEVSDGGIEGPGDGEIAADGGPSPPTAEENGGSGCSASGRTANAAPSLLGIGASLGLLLGLRRRSARPRAERAIT